MLDEEIVKILVIKENYGRLGNNIFQLICCLNYCLNQKNFQIDLLNLNSRFKLFLFDFQKIQLIINEKINEKINESKTNIIHNYFG